MNIFVARLSPKTTSEDLRELFSEYGDVKSANVIKDRETGESKRFGFVEMSNAQQAQKAIDELDECEYDDSQIVVKKANPKSEKPGGGNFKKSSGNFRGGYGDRNNGGGYDKSRGGHSSKFNRDTRRNKFED